MHACIKKYGTKVTHDFLISALDDAVLFLRVSCGEGMHHIACEWMRLDENFKSTHDLAAWALAYELDDCAVCDRGINETLFALL